MSAEKVTGVVKWFNNAKGYGFITPKNGKDVFVHFSEINKDDKDGFKTLEENQEVEFCITEGNKGQQASDVKVASGSTGQKRKREEETEDEDGSN